uniref:Uncharacterized protein n=1 Tax=Panagrolaimus sp. PS1159 TaxID=55785 RepID=A0AC35FDK1_9BILA
MLRWLFCCLILINPSEYGLFAAGYNGYKMIPACNISNAPPSNDTHYIAIIDHAVGTLYAYSLSFLFQQLFCGLNDARTPSKTPTNLCKKLEVAKKCASSIPHDQKVEIGVPLLLHETLGNCDIQNALGFANQKISIFWTNDYYKPRKLPSLSSNVEFVFFGASHDFLPQETWIPNEEMVDALKNGKSDMVKSLHLRFQKMIGINKKDIGEGFERMRPTTTATYSPSKPTTAKILNAGLNILPFFQPKPVKVQQSTTISAPSEIQEKVDHSVIGDTLP